MASSTNLAFSSQYPVVWDLGSLYHAIDDKQFEKDKEDVESLIDDFSKKYKGKLAFDNIADALVEYEHIVEVLCKIQTFAFLNYQTNLHDPAASAFLQSCAEWETKLLAKLAFFQVEFIELDYGSVEKILLSNEKLARYKSVIEEFFRFKPHTLTVPEEVIMAKKSILSSDAWCKFYTELLSKIDFLIDGEKKVFSYITDQMSHGKTSDDRRKAALSLSEGLNRNMLAISTAYNNIILDCNVCLDIRHYSDPESARYLSDNIDPKTIKSMLSAVVSRYKRIAHRYYRIKSKLLGLGRLQYWDRCVPVQVSGKDEDKITYDEAVEVVLDVFKGFSPKFHSIVSDIVKNKWVDVFPKEGKVPGAFSHPATVRTHPFIMLNFFGNKRDVLTMAHEFGHGIHQVLSSKQTQLNSNPPLALCETASTFAEKLTYDHLISNESDPKRKIELICEQLDDIMNTIFRQVSFFRFEQKVHRKRMEKELTPEEFSKIWMDMQKEALGDFVAIDSCVDSFWGYISHFFVSPFYVYSYSFGRLLVEALYSQYLKDKEVFLVKYESMLSAGGTMNFDEVVEMFGFDIQNMWEQALDAIEEQLNELENLCISENLK